LQARLQGTRLLNKRAKSSHAKLARADYASERLSERVRRAFFAALFLLVAAALPAPLLCSAARLLCDAFRAELKDLYSAENQITKTLPKMAKAAMSPELKTAFENHLQETKGQIQRLEEIFQMLGGSPKGKSCVGMKGVLDEGSEMLQETQEGDVRDAALISAAQRVEHYEMAGYGQDMELSDLMPNSWASPRLLISCSRHSKKRRPRTRSSRTY
jgi:ferritin-like metal-binding protein YciE